VIGSGALRLLRELPFDDWLHARQRPLTLLLDALATGQPCPGHRHHGAAPAADLGMRDQGKIRREGQRPIYAYVVRPPPHWSVRQ
jgi:hypothetical protein